MRVVRRPWLRVLVLLSLLTLLAPPAARAATQTVGSSTIDGGADWRYSTEASAPDAAIMVHHALDETYFMYLEEDLASLPSQDNLYLMEEVMLPRFRNAFDVTEMPQLAQGTVLSTLWYLHEVPATSGKLIALFAVDVSAVPGVGAVVVLVSPEATFAEALASAKASIAVNGADNLLKIVPTGAVLGAAGLEQPAAASSQGASQTVGASTVTYSADWAPDPNASMIGAGGQITLTHQTLADTSYTYTESPWVQNHIPDNEVVMESLVTAVLGQMGMTPSAPALTGNLADGTLWHLYSGSVNGQAIGALFTVDTADPSQMDIMSMLFSPASELSRAVGAVQEGVTVNGASPLAGIDPAQVGTALQGGAPVTGTTPILATTAPAGTTPAGASGGQSVTVSGATITYNARWTFDNVNSVPDGSTFWDAADGSGTWYGYLPATSTTADAAGQLNDFNTGYFQGRFQNVRQLALEPISPTRAWALTTGEFNGEPAVVLTYVDTSTGGQRRIQMLMSDPETAQASLADVQQSIQVDGVGAFDGVDPARVAALLGGAPGGQTPAVPGTSPSQPTQSTVPTPTATAVAQQGAPLTQSVTVGTETIAYGGGWQYNQENSSENVAFFTADADQTIVFAYLTAPNNVGADPLTAVQGATDAFFSDLGAQNLQELTAEVLPSGRAWGLYTFERNGVPGAYLIEADVTTPGIVHAQFLIGPRDQFASKVSEVQGSFQINGTGAYSELDASQVATLLGGAPTGQTVPTGQTTPAGQSVPTQTTQQSGGQAIDYRAQDAPTGCDRIGWVVTDPAQLPASQADLDARGSCVGGATYVASCGTYVVSDTGTEVQCTVNVAVGSAPMTVSAGHFTLVDAAGGRYPVDMETLVPMVLLLGAPELPESTVAAGTSTSGTLLFNVPASAPTPWTLEVAPDTIATTGEQPGVLVIEGELQSFDVFEP